METITTDVVVVGAGAAGAATALLCARRGLDVLCVDARPLERAGACWANGVPAWVFDAVGIARPASPELLSAGAPFHLIAGHGPERLVLTGCNMLEVDMRRFIRRLHHEAWIAGARLEGEVFVTGLEGDILLTSMGPVYARCIVDASGLSGARLVPNPAVEREHLCAAAQQVHRIVDERAAREFFAFYGVPWGETMCLTGLEGGYSILNLYAHDDRLSILTGSIPARGARSGRRMLDDFVASQPWVGPREFGGSYAIPIRRPYDRLAEGPVALVGDAGCQVFPAHGSGIGPALVAADLLARTLDMGLGPHDYAVAWQRRYGGLLAAYDLFRRFSETIDVDELARLLELGLIDAASAREGLEQRLPTLRPGIVFDKLRAAARAPDLIARFAPVLARMAMVRVLYGRYPEDPRALPFWSRQVARVFGEPPPDLDPDPMPRARRGVAAQVRARL